MLEEAFCRGKVCMEMLFLDCYPKAVVIQLVSNAMEENQICSSYSDGFEVRAMSCECDQVLVTGRVDDLLARRSLSIMITRGKLDVCPQEQYQY